MSTRHELPGKFVPPDRDLRRLWRDVFPPGVCGKTAPGTGRSNNEPPSGVYPELLGKIIPPNSGPVPMTAGRFPG